MATVNSVEYNVIANFAASYAPLKPAQLGGRVRVATFNKKTPTGTGLAINDLLALTKLPKGARILAILAQWEAMTTAGAAASGEIGTAASSALLVASMSFDAAGNLQFLVLKLDNTADDPAGGFQYTTTDETVIYIKVLTEAWAADKYIRGAIFYAVD
jgi:hypothetical protein